MEKKAIGRKARIALIIVIGVILVAGVSAYAAIEISKEVAEAKYEADYRNPQEQPAPKPEVKNDGALEQAKEIALKEVPGAVAEDIVLAYEDYDDGRVEYNVEIRYDGYEYDFEIDASSGNIVSKDVDRIENDDWDDRYDD